MIVNYNLMIKSIKIISYKKLLSDVNVSPADRNIDCPRSSKAHIFLWGNKKKVKKKRKF